MRTIHLLLWRWTEHNRTLTTILTPYSLLLTTYYFSLSSRVGDGNRDGQRGERPAQGRADPPVLPQSREQPRLGRPRDAHGGPQESRRQKSQDSQ